MICQLVQSWPGTIHHLHKPWKPTIQENRVLEQGLRRGLNTSAACWQETDGACTSFKDRYVSCEGGGGNKAPQTHSIPLYGTHLYTWQLSKSSKSHSSWTGKRVKNDMGQSSKSQGKAQRWQSQTEHRHCPPKGDYAVPPHLWGPGGPTTIYYALSKNLSIKTL